MHKTPKKIAVTGASGQIAYSLLFRLANGDLFGKDQPIVLSLLEIPHAVSSLQGVVMELQDCCFPLVERFEISSDPVKAFEGCDLALLIGSKPRGPGMERKDLLAENGKIFVEQGKALNKSAKKDAHVFVVGNPCNTNCLIAMYNAPDMNPKHFYAMTRLDQNRAIFQLAFKAQKKVEEVEEMIIWGNHSATQVPDFVHAKIAGLAAEKVIPRPWLEGEFVEIIQQRGAKIIESRGKSSAASAASAIIDSIRALDEGKEKVFSAGVYSKGNPYHVDEDLIFSFPLRCSSSFDWEIVPGYTWDNFLEEKIRFSEKELKEERDVVRDLV